MHRLFTDNLASFCDHLFLPGRAKCPHYETERPFGNERTSRAPCRLRSMSRQILGARYVVLIRQIHNVLTGSLDQAVRWKWRSDNPARWATLPPQRQAAVRPPTPEDVLAVIEAANQEFATFLRIAAAVGGRRGEVAALRWPAVNLFAGELVILSSLVESSARRIYEKDTKTHQSRRLAIDDGTVLALKKWRHQVEARAEACGTHVLPDGFVFSAEMDGSAPRRPIYWTSAWRRVRTKAGIHHSLRLHDLRLFTAPLGRCLARGLDGPPRRT